MKITIFRIDYKNSTATEFQYLKTLYDIKDVTDINEIKIINLGFATISEANDFILRFPKYLNLEIKRLYARIDGEYPALICISIQFDTFPPNKVTDNKYKSAIKRRLKFIEILKKIK